MMTLYSRLISSLSTSGRWFLAVMPSSEEESQWLVGSGGLAPTGGSATKTGTGERGLSIRTGLYTEEMTTQPANVATAGVNAASADSAEHDLIDSTADATLLAQFHEDAIKQVRGMPCAARSVFGPLVFVRRALDESESWNLLKLDARLRCV